MPIKDVYIDLPAEFDQLDSVDREQELKDAIISAVNSTEQTQVVADIVRGIHPRAQVNNLVVDDIDTRTGQVTQIADWDVYNGCSDLNISDDKEIISTLKFTGDGAVLSTYVPDSQPSPGDEL